MRIAREVLLGESNELQLLRAIDRFESFARGETLPRFHFHERENMTATDDEVDLTAAKSDVASSDCIAAHPIEPDGALFAQAAQLLRFHAVQATSDASASRETLPPVEVPLDVGMLDVDDDRTAVRAGKRIR